MEVGVNKSAKNVVWIVLFFLALAGIAWFAYDAGYAVGSDVAERDNRAEAR